MILAGGTRGVVRSENYDGSASGWAIFGDGSASFYGDLTIGANAIILGDVYSDNWNGTIPANLATVDSGATVGYYLDSSVGSAQFEGDVFVGGIVTVGDLTSAGFELDGANGRIEWFVGGTSNDPDTNAFMEQAITDGGSYIEGNAPSRFFR